MILPGSPLLNRAPPRIAKASSWDKPARSFPPRNRSHALEMTKTARLYPESFRINLSASRLRSFREGDAKMRRVLRTATC